jgi:hypothetical protein
MHLPIMTRTRPVMSNSTPTAGSWDPNGMASGDYSCPLPIFRAATTLLATGLLVSTFDLVELLLVVGAAFLIDFFSIAIVVSPVLFELLYALP